MPVDHDVLIAQRQGDPAAKSNPELNDRKNRRAPYQEEAFRASDPGSIAPVKSSRPAR
ncbi:MAG: hypothetical protein ABI155_10790 [Paralcaligenes sp.]